MKAKTYLPLSAFSLFTSFCVGNLGAVSFYDAGWGMSICFFELSWISAYKTEGKGLSLFGVLMAIIGGILLLELPLRISDFRGTYISLMEPIIAITSAILGIICYKERNWMVYVLSSVVLILFNSLVQHAWIEPLLRRANGM